MLLTECAAVLPQVLPSACFPCFLFKRKPPQKLNSDVQTANAEKNPRYHSLICGKRIFQRMFWPAFSNLVSWYQADWLSITFPAIWPFIKCNRLLLEPCHAAAIKAATVQTGPKYRFLYQAKSLAPARLCHQIHIHNSLGKRRPSLLHEQFHHLPEDNVR